MTDRKQVRPWDLWNKKQNKVSVQTLKERIEICSNCPELIKLTYQCKKCGCFMKQKAKLYDAECPLKKWKNPDY